MYSEFYFKDYLEMLNCCDRFSLSGRFWDSCNRLDSCGGWWIVRVPASFADAFFDMFKDFFAYRCDIFV